MRWTENWSNCKRIISESLVNQLTLWRYLSVDMKKRILCIAVSPKDLDALRTCFLYASTFEHPIGVALAGDSHAPMISYTCDIAVAIAHSIDELVSICQLIRLLNVDNPQCQALIACRSLCCCASSIAPDLTRLTCIAGSCDFEALYYLAEHMCGTTPYVNKALKQRLDYLSPREREVFHLMAKGHNSKEIAFELQISPNTVAAHRKSLYRKLEVQTIQQLMVIATRYDDELTLGNIRNLLVSQHADTELHHECFAYR